MTNVMTEHSPEPWKCTDDMSFDDCHGNLVGNCESVWTGEDWDVDFAKANAARIVACVNACAGIPTDVLLRRHQDIDPTLVNTQPVAWLSIPLKPNGDRAHRVFCKE